jgi:biotin-(acetyl-CoA carboxylase) ligase
LIKESTKTSDENQNQKLMTKWLKRLENWLNIFIESQNLSKFWGEHDLTYDDICKALTSKTL